MEIAKEKFDAVMKAYGQCSGGGIEKKTAEAFSDAVKKSVTDSQKFADGVVNFLAPRKVTDQVEKKILEEPADHEAAKEALTSLAKSVGPVAEHWRPFIETACDALEVDVSKVLPVGMVPDPAALEDALEASRADVEGYRKSVAKLTADLEQQRKAAESAQAARDEMAKQLDSAVAQVDSYQKAIETEKKRSADLAAENEALKSQLQGENAAKKKK